MKHNNVNLIEVVDDIIKNFNKENELNKVQKMYSVGIINKKQSDQQGSLKKGGNVKVLQLHLHDLETGERLLLFDVMFIPKSPAELLRVNYKVKLYKKLLQVIFNFSCINLETLRREEATKKAIEFATKTATG